MKTTKYGAGYRCDYRGVSIVAPTRVEAMAIMFLSLQDQIDGVEIRWL